ncbi:MAG TPA: AbrB/MazE/SpoVT family DNA-binding domain-containing protein [Dehalococcoidia bacterium]|nr:AbrB/MazE/SpoVT family DNA-binding domain-containing protein [Dehalococcoidia bacterium]
MNVQEYESSVSPKGQITIPLEVRRRLGIKPRDKVTIHVEDEVVTLAPARDSLESIYKSVPALPRHLTTEEMTEIAAEEHARHAANEGLRQR